MINIQEVLSGNKPEGKLGTGKSQDALAGDPLQGTRHHLVGLLLSDQVLQHADVGRVPANLGFKKLALFPETAPDNRLGSLVWRVVGVHSQLLVQLPDLAPVRGQLL